MPDSILAKKELESSAVKAAEDANEVAKVAKVPTGYLGIYLVHVCALTIPPSFSAHKTLLNMQGDGRPSGTLFPGSPCQLPCEYPAHRIVCLLIILMLLHYYEEAAPQFPRSPARQTRLRFRFIFPVLSVHNFSEN